MLCCCQVNVCEKAQKQMKQLKMNRIVIILSDFLFNEIIFTFSFFFFILNLYFYFVFH